MTTPTTEHLLLLCTVGGSPDPIVHAILKSAPTRILFLHSEKSQPEIQKILDELARYERPIPEAAITRCLLTDPQSVTDCVQEIRKLTGEVRQWTERGPQHTVRVDFTAGTKAMSAALALVAHRWPCQFSYVGGHKRDKDGVGIVQTGSEKVLTCENPWDSLAYQPIQDAAHLFNHNQPAAAALLLKPFTKRSALDKPIKNQLRAILHIAEAYAHWDAFQHDKARESFKNAIHSANDLDAALPGHNLIPTLKKHRDLCSQLADSKGKPSLILIHDLLANADRRAAEGRYDDAVARLYRATEALAQFQLSEKHQINTRSVPLDPLPQALRSEWASRAPIGSPRFSGCENREAGCETQPDHIKLSLQDDYKLLLALNDDLGQTFAQLQLNGKTSPLSSRNNSILAHGFEPTTQTAFRSLHQLIHQLADNPDLQPFAFPKLET